MEPLVALIRRFVVDFFNRHDATVCVEIMEPEYTLRVGHDVLAGRDEQYVPAVQRQLEQFPGLVMTVHRVLASVRSDSRHKADSRGQNRSGDGVAIHFSEHGASGGPGGRVASWSGIALYRWNGDRLTASVAEEDYLARRRQLRTGVVDLIDPPAAAPWDTVALAPDADAEDVVRRWLTQSWPPAEGDVVCDDEERAGGARLEFEVASTEVTELFSAGAEVAFHAVQTGSYIGGLDVGEMPPRPAALCAAGIVSVVDGAVEAGRVVRDRAGLRRALLATPSSGA